MTERGAYEAGYSQALEMLRVAAQLAPRASLRALATTIERARDDCADKFEANRAGSVGGERECICNDDDRGSVLACLVHGIDARGGEGDV